jgi:hypothetical protein
VGVGSDSCGYGVGCGEISLVEPICLSVEVRFFCCLSRFFLIGRWL